MKSSNIIWCLLSMTTLAGLCRLAAQEKKGRKPEPERAISVCAPNFKMWLYINSDGSGLVGYGAGGSYTGVFKAGTFDVHQATKGLKALAVEEKSRDTWKRRYGFSFGTGKAAVRYTNDSEPVLKMFEKAIEACVGLMNYHERPFLRGQIEKYRLSGDWVVVSAEANGKPVAALKGARLKIGDGTIETALEGKEMPGGYRIDTSKAPTHIEFQVGDTSGHWYRSYGVYKRDGGRLRICRTGDTASVTGIIRKADAKRAGDGRPAKFDSKMGVLLVLKREGK